VQQPRGEQARVFSFAGLSLLLSKRARAYCGPRLSLLVQHSRLVSGGLGRLLAQWQWERRYVRGLSFSDTPHQGIVYGNTIYTQLASMHPPVGPPGWRAYLTPIRFPVHAWSLGWSARSTRRRSHS
jgi:hypothetical protein